MKGNECMLEEQRKVVNSSFSNTNSLNDYNINNVLSDDYLETIEFKTIKKLLCVDSLEYMTDYLRNLLKVSKPNTHRENVGLYMSDYHKKI